MIAEELIKIRLHVFSPVHIGCGEVYEPTSFVVDDQNNKLLFFDPFDFISSLNKSDKEEFSKICTNGNILEVYKFIKPKFNKSIRHQEVDITEELVKEYNKIRSLSTYDKKLVINNFIINRTAYNPQTNAPYIPGSSLKGAIRTAYLNALALENTQKYERNNPKKLEEQLLKGEFSTDPFSMIKVSDLVPMTNVKKRILYAINKKLYSVGSKLYADRGPNQIFEVIYPDSSFEGFINIIKPPPERGIKVPITKKSLFVSLNKHYLPLLEKETKKLKDINILSFVIKNIKDRFKDQISKNDSLNKCYIVRLGQHSGAEAVTIKGYRNIKITKGRSYNEYKDSPTTIWLASDKKKPEPNLNNQITDLTPFGWAVIEIM
ncbi:MAG: type III-A CRISPR-associated RAMP protein Csm5 [bacterium]